MKVFAISDLHISTTENKPMDVFGKAWEGYLNKIIDDWNAKVSEEDVVLIAGDLSWAMSLENAYKDLSCLFSLKGKKVFVKGNHDYWWHGITKIRSIFPSNFYFLQNDAIKINNCVFCGSRGWSVEGSPDFTSEDKTIYLREVERFKLALSSAVKMRNEGDNLICLIHFPPFNIRKEKSLFTQLFEKYNVDKVVYGHLHSKETKTVSKLIINGIEYILTSCDKLDNKLVEVLQYGK